MKAETVIVEHPVKVHLRNFEPLPALEVGDVFTISGINKTAINPEWRWWAWWRPRMVATDELQTFSVTDAA